jgi:hypothetical protein
MMRERYLDDFTVGQIFGSGRLVIDKERIKSFSSIRNPSISTRMPRRAVPNRFVRSVITSLGQSGFEIDEDAQVMRKRPPGPNHG